MVTNSYKQYFSLILLPYYYAAGLREKYSFKISFIIETVYILLLVLYCFMTIVWVSCKTGHKQPVGGAYQLMDLTFLIKLRH